MQIEIMTKKQIKEEVKIQVEKREFKTLRLIDFLNKRLGKLEEEIKVYRNVRR